MSKPHYYLSILKPYRTRIILYVVLLLLSCACNLFQPYLVNRVISQINEMRVGGGGISGIAVTCGIMIAAAFVSMLIMLLSVRIASRVSTEATADLRTAIFDHACNMRLEDINKIGVSAMLDRSTYDIGGIMDFISMAMRSIVIVPVYLVVGCIMAFSVDGILASIMVVSIPLIIVMTVIVTKIVRPLAKRSNAFLDKQNAIVHERLSGIRVIRAFNREPFEHDRMAQATNIMADNFVKTNVTSSLAMPIATLIMNIVTVLVLFIGGSRISAGYAVTTGQIVQLIQYLTMIMNALFSAAFAIMSFPRVRVSITRMNEIFSSPTIDRSHGVATLDGSISAFDVSYHYPDSTVNALYNVSFVANPGEKIALIGGTGSGKSTLITMLTGITHATGGTLIIGGKPASDLTIDELSSNISIVYQKSDIFTATLRDNIDPMHDHTDEEIFAALDCAEFGEFAREVGLDHRITQGGNNLSGGQKQRLALARAFIKDAPIYLFDDSFSALDYLTEKKVRKNMNAFLAGKTCVIATQRISTAYNCDRILLFDGGKLIAVGTHDALMKNDIYKEIYISQTGGDYGKTA